VANFTAADVKKLRDLTAAGMMDCKKALDETDGDFDQAVEVLRVKGAAKAAKRGAEREATSGLVATAGGALVELKSETDFVAKNEDFIVAAQRIADAANDAKAGDVETLKAVELDGRTVGEIVEGLAVTIGEKIELGEVAYFDGKSVVYMHKRASDLPPAVGVLVEYDGSDIDAARAVAMQIAAMRPQYLTRDEVPAEVVAAERDVQEKKTLEEGKPEAAVARIVEGRMGGFFKEIVLLEQESVSESKKTVKAVLDDAGISVKRFARFEVGA
jgi:elongation factor Ts